MLREVRKDRRLHGHILAVVVDLVNAAVDNAVAGIFVKLYILRPCGKVTAGGHGIAAHFQDDLAGISFLLQIIAQAGQIAEFVVEGVAGKVGDPQSRAVLYLLRFKTVDFPQLIAEGKDMLQLLDGVGDLFFLRAGEILHAQKMNVGIQPSAGDDLFDIFLVHAELRAVGQAQDYGNGLTQIGAALRDQLKLVNRFGGHDADPVACGDPNGIRRFIDSGENHFFHGDAAVSADLQLSRRADLVLGNQIVHGVQHKGIGLDCIAHLGAAAQKLADHCDLAPQNVQVKDIGRRLYNAVLYMGNNILIFHRIKPLLSLT